MAVNVGGCDGFFAAANNNDNAMVAVAITSLLDDSGGDGSPGHCSIGSQWRGWRWQTSSTAVAVDDSGGNGVVSATVHNNNKMMELAARQ